MSGKQWNLLLPTGHGSRGSTVYACMDQTTGELLAVTEWIIQWRLSTKKVKKEMDVDQKEAQYFMGQVILFLSSL